MEKLYCILVFCHGVLNRMHLLMHIHMTALFSFLLQYTTSKDPPGYEIFIYCILARARTNECCWRPATDDSHAVLGDEL